MIRHWAERLVSTTPLRHAMPTLRTMLAHRVFERRLPASFDRAPLLVTPDATLEYLLPSPHCFDQPLLRVAETFLQSDTVTWDIGANLGVFTIAASCKSPNGHVLAVEADPFLAALITRSLGLHANREREAEVLCAAIADASGIQRFCIAGAGRASNFLESGGGHGTAGTPRARLPVPTFSLDDLLGFSPAPTFVKVDVEGAELAVLQGAATLLKETRPAFYIEVCERHRDAITRIFLDAGYQLYSGMESTFGESVETCVGNTLALPPGMSMPAP